MKSQKNKVPLPLAKLSTKLNDYHITYLQGFFLIGESDAEYHNIVRVKLAFTKVLPRIYLSTMYYLSQYTNTVVFLGRHLHNDKSMVEVTIIGTPKTTQLFLDLWHRINTQIEESVDYDKALKPIYLHERAYSSILRIDYVSHINNTLIKLLDLKENMPKRADLTLYRSRIKDYIKYSLPTKKLKRRLYAPRTG